MVIKKGIYKGIAWHKLWYSGILAKDIYFVELVIVGKNRKETIGDLKRFQFRWGNSS